MTKKYPRIVQTFIDDLDYVNKIIETPNGDIAVSGIKNKKFIYREFKKYTLTNLQTNNV